MSTKETGGAAFPVVHAIVPQPGHYAHTPEAHPGMTLRDYFASQVITGLFSQCLANKANLSADKFAAACYELADAFIAERSK